MPEQRPPVQWVPADKNPWKVPILDVRPFTQTMLSTSQDPEAAKNAVSYGNEDGRSFLDQELPVARSVPASLTYRRDRLFADGVLFKPTEMEHKWAIYHHDGEILFVRSWQRKVFVAAQVEQDGDVVTIGSIHGAFYSDQEPPEFTLRCADYLLRSHAMGLIYPAPLPGDPDNLDQAAVWCFGAFGNRAHCATHHEFPRDVPEPPLRSISLLHLAVAAGDRAAVDRELGRGIPIDLPATDGLAPLHWAVIFKNIPMMEILTLRGSSVDVGSAEHATPLMVAVEMGEPLLAEWLLGRAADPNARDRRGFTALHRASEMGKEPLVRLLLKNGADPKVETEGHTARSLAESRGHSSILHLL